MTNKEALEKAIQKAVDSGWKEPHGNTLRVDDDGRLFCFVNGATDGIRVYGYQFNVEQLIFNHDFAKALWGEFGYVPEATYYFNYADKRGVVKTKKLFLQSSVSYWQYHLQNMVMADDPIKYLGENI